MTNGPEWRPVGDIELCPSGKPLIPGVDAVPGLYRIKLRDGRVYIGEAANLKRRLGEYRNPTQGVVQEHVIQKAIMAAQGGRLHVCTGPELQERATRRALEAAAIQAEVSRGTKLLNEAGPADPERLLAQIAYHEAQIAKLRDKLGTMTA